MKNFIKEFLALIFLAAWYYFGYVLLSGTIYGH